MVPSNPSASRAPLARVRVSSQFSDGLSTRRAQANIPLIPSLMTAFASFAHGTEFAMAQGPCIPVEDLEPGMELRSITGEISKIVWIGKVQMAPALLSKLGNPDAPAMVRILPDRFGYARPAHDIVVSGDTLISTGSSIKPANTFVDYESVMPVNPAGPVQMFQVVCAKQMNLIANGMGVPSFSLHNWLQTQNLPIQHLLADLLPGAATPVRVA